MQKRLSRVQSAKCYGCGSNTAYNNFLKNTKKEPYCSKYYIEPKSRNSNKVNDENQQNESAVQISPKKIQTQRPVESFPPEQSAANSNPPADKESVIMRGIVADNSKYFIEKTKVCCSVKPSNLKLHLPATTGNTIYNKDFHRKPFASADKIQPMDAFRTSYPFFGATNYNTSFVPHPLGNQPRKQNLAVVKDDAPRFFQTMYGNNFKNWGGRSMNLKVMPQQNNVFGGGSFNGKTVYNSEFVPKKASAAENMGPASSNPMFLNMKIPLNTNYRNQFTPKRAAGQANYKPKDNYAPELSNPGAYSTQYKTMFDPKEHEHCHYRKVMSVKELQDIITRK